ncbi:hypothetical protein FOA52_003351 [Chlamydomonas sp. UWO 241]|nr:hypothetical protein FOA52_003351 [Chlamydomonas sp. UWO 241]
MAYISQPTDAYEEGLIDKLVPGYSLNRFRKLRREVLGEKDSFGGLEQKPKFRFTRGSEE